MKRNILVIEDSKIINSVVSKELRKLDYTISQAYTLKESKEFLQTESYELIILDLHLPDGEGTELIANIQSLTKTKVVVLTASQDEELREELFTYGIVDYIVKDKNLLYSVGEIVKIINHLSSKEEEKILIIDDSKFICKQVKTILEPRNYRVVEAYDALSGLQQLQKKEFKLLILDMELPDMHGSRVLELIRKDKKFSSLPIIVLSGTSTPEVIRSVLKNGANDFLKKPFVFEEFLLKVDLWVDYFKKIKEVKEQKAKLYFVNENLEKLVLEEVEKNRQKDKIMFAQSRQAQMGEMLSMVAHQWRQPLNSISTTTTLIDLKMKRGSATPEVIGEFTKSIHSYIKHLSETMSDFQKFFKPQKKMVVSDFEKIAKKSYTLVEPILKLKNITFEIDVKEKVEFLTYENELVQVVLNFIKNAQDALEDKEIIEPKIVVEVEGFSLRVVDNAGGVSEDIVSKIFDPYFSTKEERDGTGLGLYMSQVIVEDHCKGKLSLENRENGACFMIEIPKSMGLNS